MSKGNGNGKVIFGETLDGKGVVIFLGATNPSARVQKFLKICKGVIRVEMVATPLGLGILQGEEGDLDKLYYEAGESMPGGYIEKMDSPVAIFPYARRA